MSLQLMRATLTVGATTSWEDELESKIPFFCIFNSFLETKVEMRLQEFISLLFDDWCADNVLFKAINDF